METTRLLATDGETSEGPSCRGRLRWTVDKAENKARPHHRRSLEERISISLPSCSNAWMVRGFCGRPKTDMR